MSDLLSTTDASVWAKEFVKLHGGDEDLMIAWFANMWAATHDPLQIEIEELRNRTEASEHNFAIEHDEVKRLSAEVSKAKMLRCPDNPGGIHRWNGDGQCLECCNYATDLLEAFLSPASTGHDHG